MLTPELKNKLSKIYELVKRGATDGEKAAAQKALDKMIAKYDLDATDFDEAAKKTYIFKYATDMDVWLFILLLRRMVDDNSARDALYKDTWRGKRLVIKLTYADWVTMDCAYGYFKPHMNRKFKKLCLAEVKKKRKAKTRNARRKELQHLFFDKYIIASDLVDKQHLISINMDELSDKEVADLMRLRGIEGGSFNRQMTNGLLLN
ncbi:hypothetical protein [Mucilaginibacter sp. L3T2-6]|uniref:hypothetical protein n=1 Tax=Mucilaginibacter sp. L3T2-6 TaxID=3062491 RepID=UPI002675F70D|nr:hypothetical protein [Mucilaginibacter sp. L3T2-6]MDO3641953.1 hypothetical protein [Mucilaginibacter sp. L3T2-6]MDV6214369.1 hypothetical protein [Mucilaginibacter sp. L3T2-6]